MCTNTDRHCAAADCASYYTCRDEYVQQGIASVYAESLICTTPQSDGDWCNQPGKPLQSCILHQFFSSTNYCQDSCKFCISVAATA